MTRLPRISEQHAQALAARSTTYADEHAASWQVRMHRTTPPDTLRELVAVLRRAYQDEVPGRIHVHETDAGGGPAFAPEFKRYLMGSDFATDTRDEGTTEVYTTPFRACMAGMERSSDEATRRRAAIVGHVTLGNFGPVESAMMEGVPEWCAKIVARDAHTVFWRRLSDVRLDLRKSETAA